MKRYYFTYLFHPNVCRHDLVLQVLKKKIEKWSIGPRRRYSILTVSGYSENDLLVFRDINDTEERRENLLSLENPNKSTVKYIYFL